MHLSKAKSWLWLRMLGRYSSRFTINERSSNIPGIKKNKQMKCEVCEQDKQFYQVSYQPHEKMKVFSSLANLEKNAQEKRYFCSDKCLKEWCEMPGNWK